ncbi:MAG: hypothetical protein LBR15_00690 [Methanobrevibacter sp.]|jgi:hypothetical protein|nr:hypothetical protein [Candidatus Methanovirga australis]
MSEEIVKNLDHLQSACYYGHVLVHITNKDCNEVKDQIIKDINEAKYDPEDHRFHAKFHVMDSKEESKDTLRIILAAACIQELNIIWDVIFDEILTYFTSIKYTKEENGFDAYFEVEGFEKDIDDFLG